jgi:hypothetical protein
MSAMNSLTKTQIADIEAARLKLEDARRVFAEMISVAQKALKPVLDEVNTLREEALELVLEAYGEAEYYESGRSDSWVKSPAGKHYQSWMDHIDEAAASLEDDLDTDVVQLFAGKMETIDGWATVLEDLPHAPRKDKHR